jgi:hypothetical protein
MQHLTLVRLTEDKSALVLVADTGEEFTLAVDDTLRAALRGDHARLGLREKQMESALRPRDIQARIRAGESPESVADAAQTSVDRVMAYATPVLAERAHIAERAQRCSVRRRGAEGPAKPLGDAVEERLRARNIAPGATEWDAWRREDGRWTLVAAYRDGDDTHQATFLFDAPGRYVVPDDDEARWLVGERDARAGAPDTGPRRLSAVGDDQELPLGEDAIGMVSAAPVATADADWMLTQATDRPETWTTTRDARTGTVPADGGDAATESPAADAADAADDGAVVGAVVDDAADEPTLPGTDPTTDGAAPHDQEQQPREADVPEQQEASTDATEEAPRQPRRRATKKSRGRASVPSWDEIMFGGGRSD